MKSFSKTTWKRIGRVALIIIGIYLVLLTAISIYISSNKERLLKFLTQQASESIQGNLKIEKSDISVWRSFPKIGISLTNVTISDSVYRFPFLKANKIIAKVGLLDLIGMKVKISSVEIDDAVIHPVTNAQGYSNTYVLRSQNLKKVKSKKTVVISNVELNNVTAIIDNLQKHKKFEIRFDEADADISLTGSKYYITLKEDAFIKGLGFYVPKGYWLANQRLQAKWKLQFDTAGKILSFDETKIKLQNQPFTIKGAFYLKPPGRFRIEASTKGMAFSEAMAILKPTTSEKIKKINLTGPLDANVLIDGSLSYQTIPLVKVDFTTKNNQMVTPVISFDDCSFSGNYINQVNPGLPLTDSNSRVVIYSLKSKWGDINLEAKNISVTNLITPNLQFEFYTQCTLPQLDDQLSSETLRLINGDAKMYLSYNGPLIADPSLFDQLNAKIQIRNGKIVYVPRDLTFSECNGDLAIMGNNLVMNNFQCNLNTNHFTVNINGVNLNRMSSKEPGKATITCDVSSPALNLADFKVLFSKKASTTVKRTAKGFTQTANALDNAIENGNLYLNLKADTVTLNHFLANKVAANIYFLDNDWEIKNAKLQFADGAFNLAAKVHQVNDELHTASAQVNLENVNIKKFFYGFDNFSQRTITSSNIKGILNTNGNFTVNMNSAGKIIPSTMNGELYISLKNGALINMPSLQNIQNFVLKNRDLSNVEFAQLKDTFDIKKGDIYIHRMPIQSSAFTMYVEGVYSFENRTDISIQIPLTTLVNKPGDDFKKIDKERSRHPGSSIFLRAKDKNGQVKIGVDLFKRFRKDKYEKELDSTQ